MSTSRSWKRRHIDITLSNQQFCHREKKSWYLIHPASDQWLMFQTRFWRCLILNHMMILGGSHSASKQGEQNIGKLINLPSAVEQTLHKREFLIWCTLLLVELLSKISNWIPIVGTEPWYLIRVPRSLLLCEVSPLWFWEKIFIASDWHVQF